MVSSIAALLPKRTSSRVCLLLGIVGFLLVASFISIKAVTRQSVPEPAQTVHTIKAQTTLLDGQWAYMPGSTRQKDGLRIQSTGLAIVEQDGSGGQPNPPINLFGSHLENADSFNLTATVKQLKGSASLQLYGQIPIIADEFRIERKSVRITIADGTMRIWLWDGSSQTPALAQVWGFPTSDSYSLGVRQQADKLSFSINGHYLGGIATHDVFDSKTVWLGMDATENWLLAGLTAKPLDDSTLKIVDGSTLKVTADNEGIQQLLSGKRTNMTMGAAMALGPAMADPAYANIAFGGNFGLMTTENALKWQFVHPQEGTYTFQEGDALVALAKRHNMKIHGHALVFGEANPRWIQDLPVVSQPDKDKIKQIMLDHIKTIVGHYKDKINTWDIVNEPLADYDQFNADSGYTLRQHKWYQAMGQDYITQAFQAAHATDPNAKLFINEYGIEQDGERWDTLFKLVSQLKSQGVPIDGVGFQSHVYESADRISTSILRKHMQQLAKIGLLSRVSENDVYSEDGQAVQAQQYADVFDACLNEPTCVSYTTWGISDRYDTFKDDDGSIQYGQDFMWSDTMDPTPAVAKLRALLR